ncbi:winged helix-turn-helix domain-containing protein [Desulfitobacterium sp.]|uniref:winged helix-turn-helix domain-containing protein n=1 Tax=Desulfitobacterium sp. TaxID=49981 RepID=UPI002B3D6735|nr:helix-turn-helix domain-containing protein [Desulfitobacterium sp.]
MNRRENIPLGRNCYLDAEREILVKNNLPIALSRIQFRILYYLAQHMGQPVTDKELINYAWGTDSFVSRNDLYVCINRLRQRLEDNPKKPNSLLSLRGKGYVLYFNNLDSGPKKQS